MAIVQRRKLRLGKLSLPIPRAFPSPLCSSKASCACPSGGLSRRWRVILLMDLDHSWSAPSFLCLHLFFPWEADSVRAGNLGVTLVTAAPSQRGAVVVVQSPSCVRFFCNPIAYNPPDSRDRGIFQARIMKWVDIGSSRGSSYPRDQTSISCVSCTGRQSLYHWATWETHPFQHQFSSVQ